MADFTKDPNELGALWQETGARGEYMTGTINGVKVICFKNDKKKPGSKAPDWRVLKSTPKAEAAPVAHPPARTPITDDEIPF